MKGSRVYVGARDAAVILRHDGSVNLYLSQDDGRSMVRVTDYKAGLCAVMLGNAALYAAAQAALEDCTRTDDRAGLGAAVDAAQDVAT